MLEKKVIEKIKKYFNENFGKCDFNKMHVSPMHNRGFPDLVVVTAHGTYFLEAKAPGKKPTKLQRAKLCLIKERSGDSDSEAYWVTFKKGVGLVFLDPETDEVIWTVEA